jgi:predicted GIY-YIG superfamily endonuclease
MPIDQYEHSYEHLVGTDLPRYMKELENEMQSPVSMGEFAIEGVGVAGLLKRFGFQEDFSGCYVLSSTEKPIYVGISGSVLQRLRQHVRGTTHFDASLAYRIAAKNMQHGLTRSKAMETEEFKTHFNQAKEYIRSLNVTFVKINNTLALYFFEPYCAMKFDTSEWNTFETH